MAINRTQLQREIESKIKRDAEVRRKSKEQAEDVRDWWKFKEAPVDTGEYAASVELEKRPPHRGLPHWWVGTRYWKAHFIEFGTGPDTKTGSPFGMDTPTPEFAPAAKTAHHFGGTAGGE